MAVPLGLTIARNSPLDRADEAGRTTREAGHERQMEPEHCRASRGGGSRSGHGEPSDRPA